LPAAETEKRLIEFLRSSATLAGKDFVCRQLSVIGGAASVPALEAMLTSADTVEMARYALERIPGDASAAALRNALGKAPEKARIGVVNSLGVKRDPQAAAALAKLAGSPDPVMAEAAMSSLGKIASPPALATLAGLRKQGNQTAMRASLEAADHLAGGTNKAAATAIYRELSAGASPVMIRIGGLQGLAATLGKDAVPQLASAMKESDAKVQAAAIRFLNGIPGPEATAVFTREWDKLPAAGRAQAVTALANRGERAAVAKAMKDSDEGVRIAALAGLAAVGDPSSVTAIAETAASETVSEAERTAARGALDRMRGEAVDRAMVAAIPGAQGKVKIELIRSAGERGIGAASPALLAAVRDSDTAVRREAFRALRETAGEAEVQPLLALLTASASEADRRESERALSAALRRAPGRNAAVMEAYRGASAVPVKASLLQVMGQAGAKDSLPMLKATLDDPNPDLVRAAILALTEWPEAEPLGDLQSLAARTKNTVHQVLSLRGVLRLMDLPSQRTPNESVKILGEVMKLAQQAEEKRGVLALLPRFPTKEALMIAESAEKDAAVANEAKAAVQRLRRSVR
jgi:HEAT repeat protein